MSNGSAERKHSAILDAAYELFGSRGFFETKMSDVADQAGIAKGTVYLYFKNKEELFMAVTRRDCEGFLRELGQEMQACTTTEQKLYVIAEHHMRYYYNRKRHTNLFFRTPNNNPELAEYLTRFMENYRLAVQAVLTEGGAQDAELLAQSYIGMLDRLKMDILFRSSFSDEDARRRAVFAADLFVRGARLGAEEFMQQTE